MPFLLRTLWKQRLTFSYEIKNVLLNITILKLMFYKVY